MEDSELYEVKYKNPFEVFVYQKIDEQGFKIAKIHKALKMSAPTFNKVVKDPGQIKYITIKKLAEVLDLQLIDIWHKIDETQKEILKKKPHLK